MEPIQQESKANQEPQRNGAELRFVHAMGKTIPEQAAGSWMRSAKDMKEGDTWPKPAGPTNWPCTTSRLGTDKDGQKARPDSGNNKFQTTKRKAEPQVLMKQP